MIGRLFVVVLISVCLLLTVGCCDSGTAKSTDIPNDEQVVLTHRNQSDYDVYGYYVNRELLQTRVVRRGESLVVTDNTPWSYPGGGGRVVAGVEYETYYCYRANVPDREEWVIGQPVLSADTVVPLDQFTPALDLSGILTDPDSTMWSLADTGRPPYNDKFNPETNVYLTDDGTGDINISGSIINDGLETLLSGESEDDDN